jgi:hypothetical protein
VTLLIEEVRSTPLFQQLTPLRDSVIYAVRPHLVKYGAPTGTLTLQILDTNNEVQFQSSPLDVTTISASNYWHGYQTFNIKAAVKKNNDFRVGLVAGGGYSFSESAYIAWANGYDLGKYAPTYPKPYGLNAPRDLEVWDYYEQKRGF